PHRPRLAPVRHDPSIVLQESAPVPLVRFIQVSDLHLGSPFAWLPSHLRDRRRRELHRVLEEAIHQSIARRADAILIPGDLFDHDGVDAETLAFAVHAFARDECPPVFIAPGNHDPWFETSLAWSPRVLRARGWAWPPRVHLFTTAGWSSRALAGTPVRIWGRCTTRGIPSAERPLDPGGLGELGSADAQEIHVALFHGSREGHLPPGQTTTAPFADHEVHGGRFAYLAVGHYHGASRLDAEGDTAPCQGARLS